MNTTQTKLTAARSKLTSVASLAEQYRALVAATKEAERLEAEIAKLEAQAAKEAAQETDAIKEMAKYRNIRVVPKREQDRSSNPAMWDYMLRYERTASEMLTMKPVEVTEEVPLLGCGPQLYAAVLAQPDVLPIGISLLAGTPHEAIQAHVANKRRGYMTGPGVARAVTGPVYEQPGDAAGFTSYTPGTDVPGVRFE